MAIGVCILLHVSDFRKVQVLCFLLILILKYFSEVILGVRHWVFMNRKCREQPCFSNDWERFLSLLRLYTKNQSQISELYVKVFDVTFISSTQAIFNVGTPRMISVEARRVACSDSTTVRSLTVSLV